VSAENALQEDESLRRRHVGEANQSPVPAGPVKDQLEEVLVECNEDPAALQELRISRIGPHHLGYVVPAVAQPQSDSPAGAAIDEEPQPS